MNMKNDLLRQMREIAQDAGNYLCAEQSRVSRLDSLKDFVTSADFGSEAIILPRLSEVDQSAVTFSEESLGDKTADELWVVDPLDGTVNFFHGNDMWGVSIARVSNGCSQKGVVLIPRKNFLASVEICIKHDGSKEFRWIQKPRSAGVSLHSELSSSQIWTDWCGYNHPKTLSVLSVLDKATLYPQIRLCATASLMAVATGQIEGYVHPGPTPFDIAAACLVVEACGGKVTDMGGKPWTAFSKDIVATNGLIHDELLKVIHNLEKSK